MAERIHTIMGYVTDMDRSVGFYRDLLGFGVRLINPHYSIFDLGDGIVLGLHPGAKGVSSGGFILCYRVSDLVTLRRRLEDASVEIRGDYHETPSGVILEFADPDGNTLQALQPGVKRSDFP